MTLDLGISFLFLTHNNTLYSHVLIILRHLIRTKISAWWCSKLRYSNYKWCMRGQIGVICFKYNIPSSIYTLDLFDMCIFHITKFFFRAFWKRVVCTVVCVEVFVWFRRCIIKREHIFRDAMGNNDVSYNYGNYIYCR